MFAVERIVLAQVSLLRSAAAEAGIFTMLNDRGLQVAGVPGVRDLPVGYSPAPAQLSSHHTGEGFTAFSRTSPDTLKMFLRYQAQAERLYRRAVGDLDRLRALRAELQAGPAPEPAEEMENEPKPATDPEENTTPEASAKFQPTPPVTRKNPLISPRPGAISLPTLQEKLG